MPTLGFPTRLFINGDAYQVAGEQDRTPQWSSGPVPTQAGEFASERVVRLGDPIAGLTGSRRFSGRSAQDGVGDTTNADTSVENRMGAGPGVTTNDLSTNNSAHSVGSIGENLVIGGGAGQPALGGGIVDDTATAIWADGRDDNEDPVRYIHVLVGGRLVVVDPTDDSILETTEWDSVDGGDEARWADVQWIARRGGTAAEIVKYVESPWNGTQTTFKDADFTATHIHDGPDALYRGFSDFAGNVALLKKTTSTTPAAAALDLNWAPTSGSTVGDPGTPMTSLATLGERLVMGKETGLAEFDQDFTTRFYLEWMRAFRWEHQCRAILPVGQAGEVIVGFRRGLYLLPLNKPIGTEVLTGNESDKKGRYTAICYDGNWFYAFQESTATANSHVIKMRPRTTQGPGLFEHHPIVTRTDKEVLSCFLWPGATVSGTRHGPRLYWGDGVNTLAYFPLGETQPDALDANARFTTGAWSVTWPHDDFGSPSTLKGAYKVEATYLNVDETTGILWEVSANNGTDYTPLRSGGTAGQTRVTKDGFHQRFGPADNTLRGRELTFRLSGTDGSATAQQAVLGQAQAYVIEQPEMVNAYACTLELATNDHNDAPAEEQWRALAETKGQGPQEVIANWGDEAVPDTEFHAIVVPTREANAAGEIIATIQLRTLDFTDSS